MVSRDLLFPQAYMLRLYLEYAELFGAPEEEKSRSVGVISLAAKPNSKPDAALLTLHRSSSRHLHLQQAFAPCDSDSLGV